MAHLVVSFQVIEEETQNWFNSHGFFKVAIKDI